MALADPVFLHRADLFGPVVQRGKAFEQFVGKVGDLQKPLVQLALFHQRARAPTAPVDHLFVGQHGVIHRVPVDRRFLAVNKVCCIKIEEQRLFVAVIFGLTRGNLAAPIEREAQPLQLRFHVGDVFARPAAGVDALFHCRIFGGHPESIPAHRVQHFMAAHPLIAGQHIAHRVIAHVPDVDAP